MPAPLDARVVVDPVRSPVCAPFLAFPDAVPPADRERLAEVGRRAIGEAVVPAFRHPRTFYVTRDLPAARTSLAASDLPAGRAYYDLLLAINTTTSLDARTIHDLGRAEVARIGKATDAIVRETGYHARRAQRRRVEGKPDMQRRTFIEAIGLGLVTGPVIAQPTGRVHRIGFLSPVASQPAPLPPVEALREGLRAEGFVEGRNLDVVWRFAEWKLERLPELAADLVRLKVEVIVAALEPAIIAARGATTSIPIVMATSADAVADGLVTSLNKPGGNVTGMTAMSSVLSAKRLELLREMVPSLARVAVLWNAANAAKQRDWQDTQRAATTLRLAVLPVESRSGTDIESAFAAIRGARADGLVVLHDALTWSHRGRIVEFTARERLPAVYEATEWASAGGLLSYGVTHADLFRESADHVARILRGERPAEMPVRQPSRIPLALNVRAARALALNIPPSLLARAQLVGE